MKNQPRFNIFSFWGTAKLYWIFFFFLLLSSNQKEFSHNLWHMRNVKFNHFPGRNTLDMKLKCKDMNK